MIFSGWKTIQYSGGGRVLATGIRQEKKIKKYQNQKEEVKVSLCADDMVLFIQKNIQKSVGTNEGTQRNCRIQIYYTKYTNLITKVAFLYTINKLSETEI